MGIDTRKYYKDEEIMRKLENSGPREISTVYESERKMHLRIFKDWAYGLTYKDLSGKYGKGVRYVSNVVKDFQGKYDYIKTGKVPSREPIRIQSEDSKLGKIKDEDIALYKFYFSEKNLKKREATDLDKEIFKLRFEDKLTVKEIAKLVCRSESNVRVHLQRFNRVALAAYWYTRKYNEKQEDLK